MKAVRVFYESLGEECVKALNDMIALGAVIFNTDRHYGNFGFLVDSHTNKIIAPAPLFDHGNALLNLAGTEALKSNDKFYDKLSGMSRNATSLVIPDGFFPCPGIGVVSPFSDITILGRVDYFLLFRFPFPCI